MNAPEELMTAVFQAIMKTEGVVQVHGFVQKDKEGLHVVFNGKRYLITIAERPENDGGMVLYEMGGE